MKVATEAQDKPVIESIVSIAAIALMNLWAYPILVLWTLFGILIFPLLFVLGRAVFRWPADRLTRWCIWSYGRGWFLLMSPFVRFKREQMTLLDKEKPYLFVVNHLSFFDTFCMALLPIHNIVFAVRSWPFRMLWYRSFMRLANYLDVEGDCWEDILAGSKKAFAANGSVLFFPEGHRSRDGKLQRFYSGGFKVAIAAGIPIVPLCISGTDLLLPPGKKLMRPCQIVLRALEPIPTGDFSGKDGHLRLRKLVKNQMANSLAEMRGEEKC
ncbi:lysophospholipid acyltransferase family protein [Desulfuromusa kysingii]|nr:lysophospholipid acyltransferase family protein [Desulfuromusa kysingii]